MNKHIGFLLLLIFFVTGCGDKKIDTVKKGIQTKFVLESFDNNRTYTINREEQKWKIDNGKVTVLDFFATWCKPCEVGAEHLNSLKQKFGDKINIIGISLENNPQKDSLKIFKTKNNIVYDILREKDGFALAKSIGNVRSFPTMFLLDKEGKLFEKYVGIVPIEMLEYDINKAIKR